MQSRNMEGTAPEAPSLERAVRLRDEAELPDPPTGSGHPSAAERLPVPAPPPLGSLLLLWTHWCPPLRPLSQGRRAPRASQVCAPSVSALLVGAGNRHPALSSAHTQGHWTTLESTLGSVLLGEWLAPEACWPPQLPDATRGRREETGLLVVRRQQPRCSPGLENTPSVHSQGRRWWAGGGLARLRTCRLELARGWEGLPELPLQRPQLLCQGAEEAACGLALGALRVA